MLDHYTRNMMLTSNKFSAEREYWFAKLGGELVMSGVPTDRLRQSWQHEERAVISSRITGETFERLQRIVGGSAHAMYMMLQLGVTYLLYRYTGSEEILTGMPSFRTGGGDALQVNRFYALRMPISSADTGKALLLRIKEVVTETWKHRNISYDMIQNMLGVAKGGLFPMFNTLVLLSGLHDDRNVADLRADAIFAFDWQADHVALRLDYNALLYRPETMEQVERHLMHLLDRITGAMQQPLAELDILLEEEREQMLVAYNATVWEMPQTHTLHSLFAAQAQRVPQRQAVWYEGEALTYAELDALSNQCARYVMAQGVQPGDRVGVSAKRGLSMAVYVLGVLKAGAVYVPIDPEYPDERKRTILAHCQCQIRLGLDAEETADFANYGAEELDIAQSADSLAYVIYTSGSTGVPKGVAISHRAAVNTILDINHRFGVDEQDRVIGISSLCFDLSVYDLFGTWAAGAMLVLVRNQRDVQQLVTVATEQRVTIWNSVPAILDVALSYLDEAYRNESLRLFLLSGDWIPLPLFGKVRSHFAEAELISLGGATECAIWSVYYPVREIASEWTSLPYGMPLANQQLYVLNPDGMPCPYGVEGEIHIGGAGLAVCYFADEERTRDSFVIHSAFGRLYKTGDYGVMKRDGYIEMRGRRDLQVKVRGFRIDIKEIQAHLLQHEGVREVVVTARTPRDGGHPFLCAYGVFADDVSTQTLRDFLGNKLPQYMIPAFLVRVDSLPLSVNGKVDLNALPEPAARVEAHTDYQAPRNEIEEVLVQAWQEVLGLTRVGVYDNFFALGGDSIKALRVIANVLDRHPIEIEDMFAHQTIAELAVRMQSGREPEPVGRVEAAGRHPALLQVQAGDGSTPIFLVHPIGGVAFCYADLARELPGLSVYGLQARGFQEGETPYSSMSEMAAYYIEGIRSVQATGPYQLGGWSLGGIIAYEIARQLRAQGEAIAWVTLIDSYVSAHAADAFLEDEAEIAREFAANFARRLGVEVEEPHVVQEMHDRDLILNYVLAEARTLGVLPNAFRPEDLERYYQVYRSNLIAYHSYTPVPGKERMILFRTEESSGHVQDLSHGWHAVARELTVHQVSGNHFTVVQPPHVREIAQLMKQELQTV